MRLTVLIGGNGPPEGLEAVMKVSLKCYYYGSMVGTAKAVRRWKVGPAAFWMALDEADRWIGSYPTREEAVTAVYDEADYYSRVRY